MDPSERITIKNGVLFCEELCVSELAKEIGEESTPFFLYSKKQLQDNVSKYVKALDATGLPYNLGVALKANQNPHLLKELKNSGCTMVIAASGNEVRLALDCGFPAEKILLNGNGKRSWEVELAILNGCLLNIDSDFDLIRTAELARKAGRGAKLPPVPVLLRLNPHIDAKVHPYNSTAVPGSKFGVEMNDLPKITAMFAEAESLQLVGLHCHAGSTIRDVSIFGKVTQVLKETADQLRASGFSSMQYLDIGGGLGIDYNHDGVPAPDPAQLGEQLRALVQNTPYRLILEPGRSLYANAGILVTAVLGVKYTSTKTLIVTDGGMTEVIRPPLYGAYHHVVIADANEVHSSKTQPCDVVGPVCECGDFIARDRELALPKEGGYLAVLDAGAYCSATSSTYNMRARVPEILVEGSTWRLIRRRETYQDLLNLYSFSVKK